jgi:hypothetical protein
LATLDVKDTMVDEDITVLKVHLVVVVLSADAADSVAVVRELAVLRQQMLQEVDVAPGDSRELM